MKRTLPILLLLFWGLVATATTPHEDEAVRRDVFNGYIVDNDGVRQNGKIQTKSVTVDQIKIVFIGNNGKTTYKPTEIKNYGYEYIGENQFGETVKAWRHYRSKTAISFAPKAFTSKEVFMEVMVEGAITLYDYYVETPSDVENPYQRFFYIERQGTSDWVEVSKDNYETLMATYLESNTDLAQNIGKVNHRFRHMYNVVQRYNDWYEMQGTERMADFDTEAQPAKPKAKEKVTAPF